MKRRTLQRPLGERRYRKMFVVATEGKKTEPEYFEMIDGTESVVKVKCLRGHGNTPQQVLAKMKKFLKSEGLREGDEAWLVVDRDQWNPSDLDKLYQWSRTAGKYGLAVSNPCFEYWLLLHFESGSRIGAAECTRRLKRHLTDYDKGIDPRKLGPRIHVAIERAKAIDSPPCADWPHCEGSTTVYRLVERILG